MNGEISSFIVHYKLLRVYTCILTTFIFFESNPQIRNMISRQKISRSLSNGHTLSARKSIKASLGKNSPVPNKSRTNCWGGRGEVEREVER